MSKLAGNSDKKKFMELLDKSIEVILLLNFAFGFGTAAVSSIFSVVFWGKEFSDCSLLIQIMSFTLPAYGLTYVVNNQYLVPLKKEYIYIRATIFGAIINFLINFILIPQFGAMGASSATLITQFVVLIYECFMIRKEYSVLRSLISSSPYLTFALLMYFCVKSIDKMASNTIFSLLLEITIGSSLFFVLCLMYWGISKKTMYLNVIKDAIGRISKAFRSLCCYVMEEI
jgi:O-antigen/teichoic acid export membrane protein